MSTPLEERVELDGPDPPGLRKGVAWQRGLREVHFYASLVLGLVFLFYAGTGFLANRSKLFVTESEAEPVLIQKPLPENLELSAEALAAQLTTQYPKSRVTPGGNSDDEYRAIVESPEGTWQATVDKKKRVLALDPLLALPPELGLEPEALAHGLETRYSGRYKKDSLDESSETLRFELDSVWGTHIFTVHKALRRYSVQHTPRAWAEGLIELHRGKFASPGQKLLMDCTAWLLAGVTLTGILMGLTSASRTRRQTTWVLLAASILSLLYLILGQ